MGQFFFPLQKELLLVHMKVLACLWKIQKYYVITKVVNSKDAKQT
jgi:hypothetical protein